MFSILNGDSIDGSSINVLTSDKPKTNNNNEQSWTDPGKQNSEEENENSTGNLI